MPDKIEYTCACCGKTFETNVDRFNKDIDAHLETCARGAASARESKKDQDTFGKINELLAQIPALIEQIRQSKVPGVDTGLGEALADISKDLAVKIITSDEKLMKALRDYITKSLYENFTNSDQKGTF